MTPEIIKAGLEIVLAVVVLVHLIVKRRDARRARDPILDRRTPSEYDPLRMWQLEENVKSVLRRMDKAGKDISDLTTDVQGLPERLRTFFCPRETAQGWAEGCQSDRANLHAEVRDLREEVNRVRDVRPYPARVDRPR